MAQGEEHKEETTSKIKELNFLIMRAVERLSADNVNIMASGLVYSTLIAVVPCVSFLMVFLSAFGVLQPFIDLLYEVLIDTLGMDAGTQAANTISAYTTNATGLGIFGLVSFSVTTVFLVNKIYSVFNKIFRTQQTKSTVRRFVSILTFLIVLVVVLAIMLTLRTRTASKLALFTGGVAKVTNFAVSVLTGIGTFALVALIFFLIYSFIPNTKIMTSSALVGSLTTTIALAVALYIFTNLSSFFVNYSVIYGSLATLFISLLFLYVAWYIILIGAELVYVHQFRPAKGESYDTNESPARQFKDSIDLLMVIGDHYKRGDGALSYRDMAKELSIPPQHLFTYLEKFEKAGILLAVENKDMSAYVPARPLDQITLKEITESVFGVITEEDGVTAGEAVAEQIKKASSASLRDLTLENLLERV